jgi:hypothetical protein
MEYALQTITPEIQGLIEKYADTDTATVALKLAKHPQVHLIIAQIEGYQKTKDKLPFLAQHKAYLYASKLALEQCSSEATAKYKAQIAVGNTLTDLTGGLGIDTYFFAKKFQTVNYVEQNERLAQIACYNFGILAQPNINVFAMSAEDFLTKNIITDTVYLDPARRNHQQQKVVFLSDCEPNILTLQTAIFEIAPTILLKTSPMLDIREAIRQLANVAEIHVVAVENECKELIFVLKKQFTSASQLLSSIKYYAVNIQKQQQDVFTATEQEEKNAHCTVSPPLRYLYEPNSALMKAGLYKMIGQQYNIDKLHPFTHLYTSNELIKNFPGRVFEIEDVLKWKELKNIKLTKANITVRNFPITVAEIRKKTGIKEGGDIYLFATMLINEEKALVKCKKVEYNQNG